MRFTLCVVALALVLSGCGAAETFETVADVYLAADRSEHRAVTVALPKDASSPVIQGENGKLYICDSYELWLQTLPGGDMERTVKTISGYGRSDLSVLEQEAGEVRRYDFVWTSAGEQGSKICRAAVLDDGAYHYVLTAMCDAADAGEVRSDWNGVFQSFGLA